MSVEIILGNTELCRDVRVQFCRLVSHHLVRRRWREGGDEREGGDGERGRRWREREVMKREVGDGEREGGDGEREVMGREREVME